MDERLQEASCTAHETTIVDFKATFDPKSKADWCEVLKDVVAMANSGGGCIIFGLDDDGLFSADVVALVEAIDPADVVNKIYSYTGKHFAGVIVTQVTRPNGTFAAFLVEKTAIPLVFISPGNYQTADGKTKCAFTTGSLYFRHGAKSEPCTSDDLAAFLKREVDQVREVWLGRLRMVVEAPLESTVRVLPAEGVRLDEDATTAIRITDNPSAPEHRLADPNLTHPYRQRDVVDAVNNAIGHKCKVSSHHILAVRRLHKTDARPSFCYKGRYSVPTYSKAFIEWLLEQFANDASFFHQAKDRYHVELLKDKKSG